MLQSNALLTALDSFSDSEISRRLAQRHESLSLAQAMLVVKYARRGYPQQTRQCADACSLR